MIQNVVPLINPCPYNGYFVILFKVGEASYHDYRGIFTNDEEKESIVKDLGEENKVCTLIKLLREGQERVYSSSLQRKITTLILFPVQHELYMCSTRTLILLQIVMASPGTSAAD